MRFVIDTNILLSALFSSNGASFQLIRWLFTQEKHKLIVSTPLVIEYEDVLLRPSNMERYPQLSNIEIQRFIDDICNIAQHQSIYYLWRPFLNDPKDDMVLETAFNGQVDYIITYNLRDFKRVKDTFDIQPVTPKHFWQIQEKIL